MIGMKTMKRVIMIFLLFLILIPRTVFGQNFTLRVKNQAVVGSELHFDIYLECTSGDIYVGNCEFVLTFNNGNFTSPTYVVVVQGIKINYGLSPTILASNRLILNVLAPAFTTQPQFDAFVEHISNGTDFLIAQMKITGITNFSGSAGLAWRISGENYTIINTFAPSSPWTSSDISGNGVYTNPPDQSLPVMMDDFVITADAETGVTLTWLTASEFNCAGFHVWRAESEDGDYEKITTALIPGEGSESGGHEYSFADMNIDQGIVYWYKLEEVSLAGESIFFGPVSVMGIEPIPQEFALLQNYPNPFNPQTSLKYQIATASDVRIIIHDLLGREVRNLVDSRLEPGYYEAVWDSRNSAGQRVPSGVYIVRMEAEDFRAVRKLMLMR